MSCAQPIDNPKSAEDEYYLSETVSLNTIDIPEDTKRFWIMCGYGGINGIHIDSSTGERSPGYGWYSDYIYLFDKGKIYVTWHEEGREEGLSVKEVKARMDYVISYEQTLIDEIPYNWMTINEGDIARVLAKDKQDKLLADAGPFRPSGATNTVDEKYKHDGFLMLIYEWLPPRDPPKIEDPPKDGDPTDKGVDTGGKYVVDNNSHQ
jgi:hypothetical protein